MTAPTILILAQVDDATGEVLEDIAQRLHKAGALNLQLLASLGKKGRPGHVLLIDVPAEKEDEIGLLLVTELGVWGYRVLESHHRHFDIRLESRALTVRANGTTFAMEIRCKTIARGGELLAIKAEHDQLTQLRDRLQALGASVPLRRLRTLLEAKMWTGRHADALHLDL
ncbi:MAG TPA: nickel insertion protein [Burkholderiales bacterium]|nr:nickel insertion protein [Burkholderiales bacterium]